MFRQSFRGELATIERPGIGAPLVILPGVMSDADSWLPVAAGIALPNPIIVVNRRGRSPSPRLGMGYEASVEIHDIIEVLTTLGQPAHLFGWSYGGLIAAEAAVNGAALLSLTAYEPVSRPFAPQVIRPIVDALAAGKADLAVEIINRDLSGFDQAYIEALRASPVWPGLVRLAAPLGNELMAIDGFEPQYDRYSALGLPITLILGERSRDLAPYGPAFARFASAMPQAAESLLIGQGHLAHVDAPAMLASHIAAAVTAAGAA